MEIMFIRCNKFNIAKKYNGYVKSIEKLDKYYIISLHEGKVWSWGKGDAIAYNQTQVKEALKAIVMPEKEQTKTAKKSKKAVSSKGGVKKLVISNTESEQVAIITSFLKGKMSEKELISKYGAHQCKKSFAKYSVKRENYANFKGLSMSKIFATLKFYKRNDLIELFEKSYKFVA